MKKIVILTTGQPSTNPRVVKEADTLSQAGFQVIVLYQYWNAWATKLDKKLLINKPWQHIQVGGSPSNERLIHIFCKIIQKGAGRLQNLFGNKILLPEISISKSSWLLYLKARQIRADLYIGHNMGALPATVWASNHHGKPCAFDAEDFHRNEISNDPEDNDVNIKQYLEEKYFPQVNYLTAASPLIASAYEKEFPDIQVKTILNLFPAPAINHPTDIQPGEPLKLFWFSQTIGKGRGIEDVLIAMSMLKDHKIELHLLGDLRDSERQYFNNLNSELFFAEKRIYYYAPIPSEEIISFASSFHVGIAAESGIPFNRNICLTNKIFTYIQAGLTILASDTAAQKKLLEENPGIGNLYKIGDHEGIKRILKCYCLNKEQVNESKRRSFSISQNIFNWEKEKKKLLELVNLTINTNK